MGIIANNFILHIDRSMARQQLDYRTRDRVLKRILKKYSDSDIFEPVNSDDEDDFDMPTPPQVQGKTNDIDCSKYGRTRLHYATLLRNIELVKQYLEAGDDPSIRDNNGRTPYALAVLHEYKELFPVFEEYEKK